MTEDKKQQIQQEYESLTSFNTQALSELAEKHNLTLDQLLDIIDL